jgi:hypothetical protein
MNEIDSKILDFFERAKTIADTLEKETGHSYYEGQNEASTAWDHRVNAIAQMIQAQEIQESY